MDDNSTVDTIRTYANDIEALDSKVKTLREELKDVIEQDSNFSDVESLTEELKMAKDKLKYSLMGNSRFNELTEKLANEKEELKEAKDILSDYLVEHVVRTHEKQVEIDPDNGDAREVIVTGKLGKKQKYQTSMFRSSDNE